MPWTNPRTWADLELVSDTIMNTHVRDNLNMLTRVLGQTTNASGITNSGASATLVWTFVLNAALLATNGDAVVFECGGIYASNGANKKVEVYLAPNLLASTGVVTTIGGGWHIRIVIRRDSSTGVIATATVIQPSGTSVQTFGYTISGWASAQQIEIYLDGDATADLTMYWAYAELKRYGS